jgi:ribosomal protein L24
MRQQEMGDQDHIIVMGDRVRIRHGRSAGETGTVDNVTWHGNQFGAYAQVHIRLDDGQVDVRTIEDLEKAKETSNIVPLTTASTGK